jgi:hypothetical protein
MRPTSFPADLPGEHHRTTSMPRRGDPQAAAKADSMPRRPSIELICGPAAVHDDRPDADVVEEDDVLGEGAAQVLVDHRVAAVLDHHRGAGEALDPGQRLVRAAAVPAPEQAARGSGVRHGRSSVSLSRRSSRARIRA